MTSPIEDITIVCPGCGLLFEDWYRASINLALDDFDDAYLEEASTSTCPTCGYKVSHDVLVVREDGIWEVKG
jgi:DNA-directed RNA polymerase subunit RPC12/RpoP